MCWLQRPRLFSPSYCVEHLASLLLLLLPTLLSGCWYFCCTLSCVASTTAAGHSLVSLHYCFCYTLSCLTPTTAAGHPLVSLLLLSHVYYCCPLSYFSPIPLLLTLLSRVYGCFCCCSQSTTGAARSLVSLLLLPLLFTASFLLSGPIEQMPDYNRLRSTMVWLRT